MLTAARISTLAAVIAATADAASLKPDALSLTPSPSPAGLWPSDLTQVTWLHIPKASSSFVAAVYRYACPSVPIDDLAALLEDDCMPPITTPYPPTEYCPGFVDPARSINGHPPPKYPEDIGQVASLFRNPTDIKSSFFEWVVVQADRHHVEECMGMEPTEANSVWQMTAFFNSLGCSDDESSELIRLSKRMVEADLSPMKAATARCDFMAKAVLRLHGGQTRMALGGFYFANSSLDTLGVVLPAETPPTTIVTDFMAFSGKTDRFEESVCAFHLSLGGCATRASDGAPSPARPPCVSLVCRSPPGASRVASGCRRARRSCPCTAASTTSTTRAASTGWPRRAAAA